MGDQQRLSRMVRKPYSQRAMDFVGFADLVVEHIDNYTIKQYDDKGKDLVTEWTAHETFLQLKKYMWRFKRQSREGQDELDMLKIAHYACMIYFKLKEEEGDAERDTGDERDVGDDKSG